MSLNTHHNLSPSLCHAQLPLTFWPIPSLFLVSLSLSPEQQDLRNPKLVQIYLNFDSDILLCFLCFNIPIFWYLFSSCIYFISPVVINVPFRFLYCDIFNIIMKCLEKPVLFFLLFGPYFIDLYWKFANFCAVFVLFANRVTTICIKRFEFHLWHVTKGEKDKFVDVLSLFEYFVDLDIHG